MRTYHNSVILSDEHLWSNKGRAAEVRGQRPSCTFNTCNRTIGLWDQPRGFKKHLSQLGLIQYDTEVWGLTSKPSECQNWGKASIVKMAAAITEVRPEMTARPRAALTCRAETPTVTSRLLCSWSPELQVFHDITVMITDQTVGHQLPSSQRHRSSRDEL